MCQQNFPKRVNLMPKIGFVHLIEPTLNKEEDMMKEAYAQSIECEEPCEGRLSRTVL